MVLSTPEANQFCISTFSYWVIDNRKRGKYCWEPKNLHNIDQNKIFNKYTYTSKKIQANMLN